MFRSIVGTCAVIVVVAAFGAHFIVKSMDRPGGAPGFSVANLMSLLGFRPPLHAVEPSSGAVMAIASDSSGHYRADVEIDGRRIPMLVDTGASLLSLTSEDADVVGIRPMPMDFKIRMQTANGISAAAPAHLNYVRVGTVGLHDVDALVMPRGASAQSLLGMSFLKKLNGFEVSRGMLVLKQ